MKIRKLGSAMPRVKMTKRYSFMIKPETQSVIFKYFSEVTKLETHNIYMIVNKSSCAE